MDTKQFIVEQSKINQYQNEGWCILESVLSEDHHILLLEECDVAINKIEKEMQKKNIDVIGGSRKGLQYSPWLVHKEQPRILNFLLSDFMGSITKALLGENVYLFSEQYVVKLGEKQSSDHKAEFSIDDGPQSQGLFSWHQDSGYVPFEHTPYLSCWIALDDITEDKGALRILPFSDIGIKTRVQHIKHPSNGDLVGYFGDNKGFPAIVPKGSIICFSSNIFHWSGQNHTDQPRRGYLAQYSIEPIKKPNSDDLWSVAIPLVIENNYVNNFE